jgi:hypothetical protein
MIWHLMASEKIMFGDYIGIQMGSVVIHSAVFYFQDIAHPSVLI